MTIGRDDVSPHQIPHTEIFESFVVWEVGNGALQDMLRGGIGSFMVIPGPVLLTGSTPPDMRVRGRVTLSGKERTIILKDMGIVTNVVMMRGVRRHKMGGE